MSENAAPVTAPVATPGIPGTNAPAAPEAPKPEEFFEIKSNGQPRKLTLSELKARAELADGAHGKFEEASKLSKATEAKLAKLKGEDLFEALTDLGLSEDQIFERFEKAYYRKRIEPDTLTPEQLELKRYREQEAKRNEDAEKEKMTAAERAEAEETQRLGLQMQTEILKTLESSNLPKTRFTVSRMVYWQKQNLARGYDAPQEVILQQVKDEERGIARHSCSGRTPEQVVEHLGEEIVDKVRQYDLQRLKARFEGGGQKPSETRNQGSRGRKTYGEVDNYFNELRRSK